MSVRLVKGSNDEKQDLPTSRAHLLTPHFYQKWENRPATEASRQHLMYK